MTHLIAPPLPLLPLVLWRPPPGLEMILSQEGVAFVTVHEPRPFSFHQGRFVLYDGRTTSQGQLARALSPSHIALDIDALRAGEPRCPFKQLVSTRSQMAAWRIGGAILTEKIACVDRAALRARLLARLRQAIVSAGGLWARLSAYPYPYRSVFGFRVDLDEPEPDDYARFAHGRRALADCTTHFVSTAAYGAAPEVLADLRDHDTQSHGHYHHVYRDERSNRVNLERAHQVLAEAGIEPIGFAAPSGRWNPALDRALETLGYAYSSDFQIGWDDRPYFPWLGDRFSTVLQVPVHPICEGLFQEAGVGLPRLMAEHLVNVVRARVAAGEPAFVYGHPERRLGRFPHVMGELARAIAGQPLLWRATLTDFARWWRWRDQRRWSLVERGPGLLEAQFDEWDDRYPIGLELVRGEHVAHLPLFRSRAPIDLATVAFERRRFRVDLPEPTAARRPWALRPLVREALDWETMTPIEELTSTSPRAFLKKRLRRWRERGTRP